MYYFVASSCYANVRAMIYVLLIYDFIDQVSWELLMQFEVYSMWLHLFPLALYKRLIFFYKGLSKSLPVSCR